MNILVIFLNMCLILIDKITMAGPDVAALAADLARAVELMMSAEASQHDRSRAYQACESFKETSPLCAEAGLYLAAGTQHSDRKSVM